MEKKDGDFCKENFRVRISAMYLYSAEKQFLTSYMYTEERKSIGAAGKRNLGSRTGNNLMDNFSSVKEKTRVCAA